VASGLSCLQQAGVLTHIAKYLSSGVYFYALRAGGFEKTLRMVVVR